MNDNSPAKRWGMSILGSATDNGFSPTTQVPSSDTDFNGQPLFTRDVLSNKLTLVRPRRQRKNVHLLRCPNHIGGHGSPLGAVTKRYGFPHSQRLELKLKGESGYLVLAIDGSGQWKWLLRV